jgi:hypothetical protein
MVDPAKQDILRVQIFVDRSAHRSLHAGAHFTLVTQSGCTCSTAELT